MTKFATKARRYPALSFAPKRVRKPVTRNFGLSKKFYLHAGPFSGEAVRLRTGSTLTFRVGQMVGRYDGPNWVEA